LFLGERRPRRGLPARNVSSRAATRIFVACGSLGLITMIASS